MELLVFDANYIDGKVRLDWTTATEINNDFFTIERCHNFCDPNKPESWEIVTTVDGSGNTSNEQSYSAYDYEPYSGISYYRLKQTDFDGKYEYFNPVAVEINKEGGETIFEVYPNPTSQDNINLGLIGHKKNDEVLLVLKNTLGQVIYSKVIITNEFGNAVTAINPNHKLAQGVYLVIGSSENAIYSKKLIIK
ncbi:MAG: hypothetical protein COA57_13115 [Flavobacteriales bacterium]|nr:MAG: hypothetical protein COA57_13115 [Flavobacteriales bacterium]